MTKRKANAPAQLLFVQGAGEGTHDEWDNKLVDSLQRELGDQYEIQYPRMPNEVEPGFKTWKGALVDEFSKLEDGAILVGHSIGGSILINVIASTPLDFTPGAIVLIAAPFIGKDGWPAEGFTPSKQIGKDIPPDVPVLLYQGDKDETVPASHLELYAHAIPSARTFLLKGRDHQLGNNLQKVAQAIHQLH